MRVLTALIGALCVSACETTAGATPVPAVLETGDEDTLAALKAALAKTMNKSVVTLGAGDLTQSSIISVLPKRSYAPIGAPQNQAGNFALPTRFTLMMDGGSCYVVKDGSDEKTMLKGVKCRPAQAKQ